MGIAEILKDQNTAAADQKIIHRASLTVDDMDTREAHFHIDSSSAESLSIPDEDRLAQGEMVTDNFEQKENIQIVVEEDLHEEREPLLGHKGDTKSSAKKAWLLTWINWDITRDLAKAVIAFTIAMSFSFVDAFKVYGGEFGFLAAVTVLFFHPSKSVGALLEAVFLGLLGVIFGSLVSLVGLYFTYRMQNKDELVQNVACIMILVFFAVFLLSYIRAKSSRPPVYTGIVISHMLICITLMGNVPQNIDDWNINRMLKIVTSILFGASVSLLTNLLFWPKSAYSDLRVDLSASLQSVTNLVDILVSGFLLENMGPEDLLSTKERVEYAMFDHRAKFAKLTRTNAEAKLEFLPWTLTRQNAYQPLINSMNRITQHVGGMKSSLIREEGLLSKSNDGNRRSSLLFSFLDTIGPHIQSLAEACKLALKEANRIALIPRPFFGAKKQDDEIRFAVEEMQDILRAALIDFETKQREKLMVLYESEKFDGTPNEEVFLVYFFVFCMIEFVKEVEKGLLTGILKSHYIAPKKVPQIDNRVIKIQVEDVYGKTHAKVETSNPASPREHNGEDEFASKYYDYLQSQTNDVYRHYLKNPHFHSPHDEESPAYDEERNILRPPVEISPLLRYRLYLWRFLSDLGRSFELKFALKSAILVTSISLMGFLPQTMDLFLAFKANWCLISIAVVMTPTVGGTNLAGLYRLFGTFSGVLFSYLILYFFGDEIYISWALLALFAIPCFYAVLFSKYPRVGQVAMVSVSSITLRYFCNPYLHDLFELAWKQGLMVSSGLVLGLLVTWYVWPYEARVELRKGLSDLLLNMGILYSRLVEVFNPRNETENRYSLIEDSFEYKANLKITPTTLHRYYYTQFEELTTKDTLSYFLAFELKVQMDLLRLESLIPLTWLEPRLKGPFPVEVYQHMLKCCQRILDKFVAMRVAIANNVAEENINAAKNASEQAKSTTSPSNFQAYGMSEDLILGLAPSSSMVDINRQSTQSEELDSGLLHRELVPYRRDMVGSVLLCFYVYAGSLILKQPLPTYLPQAKEARERLLKRIRNIVKQNNLYSDSTKDGIGTSNNADNFGILASPQKFINYYAYSLAMEDVINELELLGNLLKSLFGEMFADIFNMEDDGDYRPRMHRVDSSVSLSYEEHEAIRQARKKDSRVSLQSPHPIPLYHHNRADRWGMVREQVMDQMRQKPRGFADVAKSLVTRDVQSYYETRAPLTEPMRNLSGTDFSSQLVQLDRHEYGTISSHASPNVPIIRFSEAGNTLNPRMATGTEEVNISDKDKAEWWRASGNWML